MSNLSKKPDNFNTSQKHVKAVDITETIREKKGMKMTNYKRHAQIKSGTSIPAGC